MAKDIESKVKARNSQLYSLLSSRMGKYIRSFNRYTNNGARREGLDDPQSAVLSYINEAQGTEGVQTQINIIKSCIDTITSKISQATVRPYFSPVNGEYETVEIARKIQTFFDTWLEEQHAYPKSVLAFRDAAIFDIGVLHADAENASLQRVPPWQYYLDPTEYATGAISSAMWMQKQYPIIGLADKIDNRKLKAILNENPYHKGEFTRSWDLYNGYRLDFYEGELIHDPIKLDYEQYGGLYRRPFVEMYYTKPIKAFYSTSLADDLYTLQKQIDELVRRMDAATRNAILSLVLVPKGSGLKASNLGNNVHAYDYNPGPDGGSPVVMNPNVINEQFVNLLKEYIEQAYAIAGISQLSAQSKKTPGLDSGKALDTMEDIESDRFNVQLQQFTHFLVDVSRVCIDCFPKDKEIIKKKYEGKQITWGDVRNARDSFNIQFSAASSLSRNPEERRNEIKDLLDLGVIEKGQVSRFYQQPDLESAYTLATANEDYASKIIDTCVRTGDISYQATADLETLMKMALKRYNQMMAAGDKEEFTDRLLELITKIDDERQKVEKSLQPPPQSPPPEPMKDSALDSGQIMSLTAILEKVASGVIPQQSASVILGAAFPKLPPQAVEAMMAPFVNKPALPGSIPPGAGQPLPVGQPQGVINA